MGLQETRQQGTLALSRVLSWRQEKKAREGTPGFAALPPMLATAAILGDRLRMAKVFCFGTVALCLTIVGLQEWRFQGALEEALDRNFLVIPGVVDFMRVRPGTIPDNVVFYFAEYAAEQAGTFRHTNIEEKYQRLSEFMSPDVREVFLLQMRKQLPLFRELAITEVFSADAPKTFNLVKDADGRPVYEVNVFGRVDRYSNDQRLRTDDEVMRLRFRTTRITSDKPWFFEILSLKRQTRAQFAEESRALEQLAQKGDSKE